MMVTMMISPSDLTRYQSCVLPPKRGMLCCVGWLTVLPRARASTGGLGPSPHSRPNPAPSWLVDRAWRELCKLSCLPAFMGLDNAVESDPEAWRALYDSPTPHKVTLPGDGVICVHAVGVSYLCGQMTLQ